MGKTQQDEQKTVCKKCTNSRLSRLSIRVGSSLLRATYGGVVDMSLSMGRDGAWFFHCILSVAAELLTAVTASIAGALLFSAWA